MVAVMYFFIFLTFIDPANHLQHSSHTKIDEIILFQNSPVQPIPMNTEPFCFLCLRDPAVFGDQFHKDDGGAHDRQLGPHPSLVDDCDSCSLLQKTPSTQWPRCVTIRPNSPVTVLPSTERSPTPPPRHTCCHRCNHCPCSFHCHCCLFFWQQ